MYTKLETALGIADFYTVLHGANALALGRAEASGPGRGQRALALAYQQRQFVGSPLMPVKTIMVIQCRPEAQLEMDELTEITETLQGHLGGDCEMIFGYGEVNELPEELSVMFLVAAGYRTL